MSARHASCASARHSCRHSTSCSGVAPPSLVACSIRASTAWSFCSGGEAIDQWLRRRGGWRGSRRCRGYLPNQPQACPRRTLLADFTVTGDATRARPVGCGVPERCPSRLRDRTCVLPCPLSLTCSPRQCMTAPPALPVGGDQEPHKRPEEGGRDAACAGRGGPAVVRVPFGAGSLQLPHTYARGTPLTVRPVLCRVRRCTASARPSRRSQTS